MNKKQTNFSNRDFINSALEVTSEGIIVVDKESKCLFINKVSLSFLGLTKEECLGKNIHSPLHSKRFERSSCKTSDCLLYKAQQENKPARLMEEVLWYKDGRSRNVLF